MELLKQEPMVVPEWEKFHAVLGRHGLTLEEGISMYVDLLGSTMFRNEIYTAVVREQDNGVTHLSIRRNDGTAARDWRHFQQIKNQLCGEDREAIELYPEEKRVVDTANQSHLWVLPRGFVVPVGFHSGLKVYEPDPSGLGGIQRGLEEELP